MVIGENLSALSNEYLLKSYPLWIQSGILHYLDSGEEAPQLPDMDTLKCQTKKIHILKETHPLIERLFNDTIRSSKVKVGFAYPSPENIKNLESALLILSKYHSYSEINLCLDAISFISGENIIAFTAIEEPGLIFIKPRCNQESELFFCEHIVHEVSHIVLNYEFINIQEHFTINPFELEFNSPFREDKRGLYHVVHALYVLSRITLFFSGLTNTKMVNDPFYSREIFGRLSLASYRLEISIGEIEGNYYTKKGLKLFNFLREVVDKYGYSKNPKIARLYIENQNIEYNHDLFLSTNKHLI